MTRADLVAAVDAAAHRMAVARVLAADLRRVGFPVGDDAAQRAESEHAEAVAALARFDRPG